MLLNYLQFVILWIIIESVYFKIAKKYSIFDKPNARSSHFKITIRGGGIVFPVAIVLGLVNELNIQWILLLSFISISIISFIDDIRHVDSKIRLFLQSISVAGLLYTLSYHFDIAVLLISFIIVLGVINAYNFMDGINGITVLYSLVTLVSMYWVNKTLVDFFSDSIFIALLSALTVFGYLNLRKKAFCFSGDVGSVSLAFIFCYLLLKISITTHFNYWILFFGIYGIDTVGTIICRFFRNESLLQAHRSHFYQYLVNEAGLTHVLVSVLYASAQLVLNIFVIYSFTSNHIWPALTALFGFVVIYIIFRLQLEGSKRLFGSYNPER